MRTALLIALELLFFIPNTVVLATQKLFNKIVNDYIELQVMLMKFIAGNDK